MIRNIMIPIWFDFSKQIVQLVTTEDKPLLNDMNKSQPKFRIINILMCTQLLITFCNFDNFDTSAKPLKTNILYYTEHTPSNYWFYDHVM